MKNLDIKNITILLTFLLTITLSAQINTKTYTDPEEIFTNPPESAKPGVLWMWMGSNISKEGIKKDLETLKEEGFNRTTMFSLADVTTPWADEIDKSPTPQIIAWTEPWWKLVRYAAEESKRLGMDFGMFNGAGYESSGGIWITPELSMQEICWSQKRISGNQRINIKLCRPYVDPHANQPYPVYDPETGLVEKPLIKARKTYYKDIAVLAAPAKGIVSGNSIFDLTGKMDSTGNFEWNAPEGDWIIYRFGHTTMGTLIQPAQWKATGLECDKMSKKAVEFHIDHVINEIKKHLGDLIGSGFTHVHFDSYEAGTPTWTPKMREEFLNRRGYDLLPYLITFAGRTIDNENETKKFKDDFDATIKDLYRDVYFKTISDKLHEAHLRFLCEPYGGPWRQDDIMPLVHDVMTEFWTTKGKFSPYELEPTVAALRKSGQNIIEAEAFTGHPDDSRWDETPAWLKPIGDAAFCAGVNRFVLHRFVEQPWDDKYKPGATMGQWGTHFDRTQTWWKPFKATVKYWTRCQALLQWGKIVLPFNDDFSVADSTGNISLKSIHRNLDNIDIYFVANTARAAGSATCTFKVSGMQPELWDPVTGSMRLLPQYKNKNGYTSIPLKFAEAQSFFIVFRNKSSQTESTVRSNFPDLKEAHELKEPWLVQFDSAWGGPAQPVTFDTLWDWITRAEPGIKYFSGTAVYKTVFNVNSNLLNNRTTQFFLDLGSVKCIARVKLNNKDLGVVWTAPWHIQIPQGILQTKSNELIIEVTNVWANRLIGDEQQPEDCKWLPGYIWKGRFLQEFPDWFLKKEPRPSKGRYCFTTWNYFTKDSPLVPSGLIGPVRIISAKE